MEVKEFRDSRKVELDGFQKKYTFLKKEYAKTLSKAIEERDSSVQEQLIAQVKQINSQLVEEIRVILGVLNKGSDKFEAKTLDDLTNDLIKYQKEYAELEKTRDRVNTLKLIKTNTLEKLSSETWSFYLYVTVLVLLCFFIVFLIIRTSFIQIPSILPTKMLSQSV
jgi:hypothetical protein